jgi:hypothetical protein
MSSINRTRLALSTIATAALMHVASSSAAAPESPPTTIAVAPTVRHDGAHDFDFNVGVWKTEIHRVLDPLTGSKHAIDLRGMVTVRALWDGRAQIEEIEADGPAGHMRGMTLFLYDPAARQWSQTFASNAGGPLSGGLVGSFDGGRGELIGTDTFDGRTILIRAVWSDIQADSHRFEETYSDDGGKTWTPAFTARLTRVKA